MEDLIPQIEQKFALLLAIAMFFRILIGTYFTYAGGTTAEQKEAFSLFPLVGLYILAFVFFELSRSLRPIEFGLEILDGLLLAGIACFAVPTIVTVVAVQPLTFPDPVSYHLGLWEYTGSLFGLAAAPWVILLFSVALLGLQVFAQKWPTLAKRPIWPTKKHLRRVQNRRP